MPFEVGHAVLRMGDGLYPFDDLFLGEGSHRARGVFPSEQVRLWISWVDGEVVVKHCFWVGEGTHRVWGAMNFLLNL